MGTHTLLCLPDACILMSNFVILLYLLFVFPGMISAHPCSTVFCSQKSSIPIRFPFSLESNPHYQDCGYPGFSLKCTGLGKTVLKIPRSGEFFLRDVSYAKQQIWLYDPGNCLPARLMKLNLSGSPFSCPHHLEFTFLSCPKNQTSESGIIYCLSNNRDVVLATYNKLWADLMTSLYCKIIGTAQVPISQRIRPSRGYLIDLNKDIPLSWHDPDCKTCESKRGVCSFKSNSTKKIGCSNMKSDNKAHLIAMVVTLSITLPTFACGLGIWCHRNKRRSSRSSTSDQAVAHPAFSVSRQGFLGFSSLPPPPPPPPPLPDRDDNSGTSQRGVTSQSTDVPAHLAEMIIQSFPKLVVGDSRHMTRPNGNDDVCAICRSKYRQKDILKILPRCDHCFHAKCVDDWLRIKIECPICRNSTFFP
ncbi:hypothetical protein SAY86_012389 [Trapa natans]|uniref:RING-type domain-containing protein n=1 Tax=Trapa natans TaxID=22666 RepID=A0AAN7MCX4_TRANT|nr:hypothetical protein SAY86_012389 [Trapa natans]